MPMFSHYAEQITYYNPDSSGYAGNGSIGMLTKNQWLGYAQAPETVMAYGETRILKRGYLLKKIFTGKNVLKERRQHSRTGIGAAIICDHNGLLRHNTLLINYAYHFFHGTTQFSLGLSSSFAQYSTDRKNMEPANTNDPLLLSLIPVYSPDFNIGCIIRTQKYFFSVSAINLANAGSRVGKGESHP